MGRIWATPICMLALLMRIWSMRVSNEDRIELTSTLFQTYVNLLNKTTSSDGLMIRTSLVPTVREYLASVKEHQKR